MTILSSLRRCDAGNAVVEFALLAPVFLAMLFGILEASRIFWIKQSLDEVAYSTARCMSVSSNCDTTAAQRAYAVQRAADYGISIAASGVAPTGATTCKGIADSNSVTISMTIDSPLDGFVPAMPQTLSASACFPVIT